VAAALVLAGAALLVAALLPRAGAAPEGRTPAAGDTSHITVVGDLAPDFATERIDGEGDIRLSGLRGGPVVLNFWASWCSTCREEAAALAAGQRRWSAAGITFLGVNSNDDPAAAQAFQREFALAFPSVGDTRGEIAQAYHVTAFPETFVVGGDGRVIARWAGALDPSSLDALLASYSGRP
jgi:cytochrome c biogenesis protein CcmG/thiol:disulfide interchange protein DsbE